MRPDPAVVLALLLVVVVAIPVGSTTTLSSAQDGPRAQFDDPSPVIAPVDDFANYASIPAANVTATDYSRSTVDVTTTIATDSDRLRGEYRTTTFENSFGAAENESERERIVSRHVGAAEDRTAQLQQRRAEAIRAYADGRLTASAFARQLALVDAEAQRLAITVDRIKEVARQSSYSLPRSLDTRLEDLRGELEVLRGPVAQRVSRAVAGGERIDALYVESSETGYTLAMVDGDSYYRETFLANERKPDATDQFRESDLYLVNAANRRGVELYPWITNDTSPSGQALGESGIYRFRAEYTSGDLTAYLDGGTTNVFREHQRQSVTAVPVTSHLTSREQSLVLQVNTTYETGPMAVRLVDNATGEPVNATVRLDDQRVGTTGADGRLWLVEPRPGVPLTVRTESGTVVEARIPP